jgi:hypothetical protein
MLGQQAADLQSGIPVSNKVETGALDARHLGRLKDALKLAGLIPEMVRSWMFDRPAASA